MGAVAGDAHAVYTLGGFEISKEMSGDSPAHLLSTTEGGDRHYAIGFERKVLTGQKESRWSTEANRLGYRAALAAQGCVGGGCGSDSATMHLGLQTGRYGVVRRPV